MKDLGLTLLEAKIYLTLTKIGASKVITLANASNVSRPDIYRILHKLTDLGLVEKLLGIPSKWKAIPLEIGLSFLLEQRKNKTKLLEKMKQETLKSNGKKTKDELIFDYSESQFMIIPKKKAIFCWIIDI